MGSFEREAGGEDTAEVCSILSCFMDERMSSLDAPSDFASIDLTVLYATSRHRLINQPLFPPCMPTH